jgi:hypothetical protein
MKKMRNMMVIMALLAVLGATELQQVQDILDTIPGVTLEEATYLLGPGHNFNVSSTGIVTLDSGRYQLPGLEAVA